MNICYYFNFSFADRNKVFLSILTKNKYFRTKQKPILIAIAGDSGVGKSTITKIL